MEWVEPLAWARSCREQEIMGLRCLGSQGLPGRSHGLPRQPPHLADFSLHFPQLPLVSLGIALQLVVVVLEAADQMAHLPVDGPWGRVGNEGQTGPKSGPSSSVGRQAEPEPSRPF